jgi:hypothetical protein
MDQHPVRAVAHRTVPFSQHNGRRRRQFCMLPFKLHTVTTLTDMVDPDAPCPTRHALEASEGPGLRAPRRRRLRPGKSAIEAGDPITNGNAPAARRRRTIRAIARFQAAAVAPRARVYLLIPTKPASKLQTYPRSPATGLRPDYKWSSAPGREPAVLRPPLLAAARCHPRASSPVT